MKHGSSSAEVDTSVEEKERESQENKFQEETSTSLVSRSRLGNREWFSCRNCQEKPTENKNVYSRELNVLGHQLNLRGKGFFRQKNPGSEMLVILLRQCPLRIHFTLLP